MVYCALETVPPSTLLRSSAALLPRYASVAVPQQRRHNNCILPELWIVRFLVTYKQAEATFSK